MVSRAVCDVKEATRDGSGVFWSPTPSVESAETQKPTGPILGRAPPALSAAGDVAAVWRRAAFVCWNTA